MPIWPHETESDIHILYDDDKWWITHYLPADAGGKDFFFAGRSRSEEQGADAESEDSDEQRRRAGRRLGG